MSGARDVLARIEASVDRVLSDSAASAHTHRLAFAVCGTGDMLLAAEAMVPLILSLEDAAETLAAHAKRLRQVLAEVMDETGCATLRGETHIASVSAGRAGVVITDETAIPPSLMRQPPPAPDKAAISKLLRGGKAVPGCMLGNAGPTLTIRRRDP